MKVSQADGRTTIILTKEEIGQVKQALGAIEAMGEKSGVMCGDLLIQHANGAVEDLHKEVRDMDQKELMHELLVLTGTNPVKMGAEVFGVSHSCVGNWMAGRSPMNRTNRAVAEAVLDRFRRGMDYEAAYYVNAPGSGGL